MCNSSLFCFCVYRASWGRPFMVVIRYIGNNSGNPPEDFELWSHTNETVASFRRHIMQRYAHRFVMCATCICAATRDKFIFIVNCTCVQVCYIRVCNFKLLMLKFDFS